jgi:hypothetical protein
MAISSEESVLFEKWKGNREGFVFDGLVSELDYLKSNIKLCFVLKEVNDLGGGGWDLREFIGGGARWQTWDNVSRWVTCIRDLNSNIKWSELEKVDDNSRRDTLRSICAFNLKKSPGSHTTEKASFNAVVSEDKDYIKKQYDLYNADITVCCGTGLDLRWALDLNDGEVFETSRGIKWFKNKQDKPVFIYPHPAARVQDSLIVYGLIDAIREVYV